MSSVKYTRIKVRNKDKSFSGSPRAKSDRWQLIIERDVPNPDYIPKDDALDAEGNDTRTRNQKRRTVAQQVSKMYDGKPITEAKAREAAKEWLENENAKLSEGATVTVSEYIDQFLTKWERNVEASTMKDYRNVSKRLKREFADVALRDLTGKRINAWIDKMHHQGLSQATQRKAWNLLRLVCKQAVKADDLDANPCDKANAPKAPKPNPNPLTEKSRSKLFELLEGMELMPLATAIHMGIYMGLREGAICGLQWKRVDFKTAKADICQSIGRGEGKDSTYIKRTKNDNSIRVLPIPAPLLEVLEARKAKMRDDLEHAGVNLDDEGFGELFVIGSIDGRYQNPNVLSRQWHNLALTFDLVGTKGKLCVFHDLRHTFATVAAANHIDVMSAASYLGHDATVFLHVYADADEQAKRAAADVMANAYDAR